MTYVLAAEEINPLAPHPVEIIVGLIAFLLLFLLLRKFAFPQFEKVYAERTEKIEGGLKRAEEAQAEANRKLAEYEEQLAGLRAEAARIRDEARAEGQTIKAELRAQAEEEAQRIVARGSEQLAAERERAVRQLRSEIGGLSVQLAERLIGESLSNEESRRRTVDSFLGELDELGRQREAAPAGGTS